MTEFLRRWHITLGAWFRDYIYIPLGGSRQGLPRTICNLLVVWLLTGIWHGSTWNFLLWGLFLFCLIALEKLGLGRVLDRHRFLSRIYMLLVIPLSWLLFAVPDLPQIGVYFSRLFPFFGDGIAVNPSDFIRYGKQYGLFLLLGFCSPAHGRSEFGTVSAHLPLGRCCACCYSGGCLLYGRCNQRSVSLFQF